MLIKLYEKDTDMAVVEKVVRALKDGALVIAPTDTVYAWVCDLFNARAVEAICKKKAIDVKKARLSFLCDDLHMASQFAKIDNVSFRLMKDNLPGPFTFIMEGNSRLPKLFKSRKTVGIRIPDNSIVRIIARELGNPLMVGSLKSSSDDETQMDYESYLTDPSLIEERYGDDAAFVIDGGEGHIIPSTIVDCSGDAPEVVRQGMGNLRF